MSMLDELLFIKRFREQQAETLVFRSRADLAQARRAEDEASALLERFRVQAQADEQAWYQALCERPVKLREITRVQEDVSMLRAAERAHEQSLEQAGAQRASAQQAYAEASQRMRDASAVREKFVELVRREHLAASREHERREELEFEELSSVRRDREDWGSDDE
jgi:type III secretion protein O